MLVIFVGLLAFAAGQDNTPDCGKVGQRCCRLADYEVDTRPRLGKIGAQKKTDKFRYCVGEYYDDQACDLETDTCIDEDKLDCGREGERCCNLKNDVAGDYPSMQVCFDKTAEPYYYAFPDLYCDFTDNKCKQFKDLSCGSPGEACCSEAILDSSEDEEFLGKYSIYAANCSNSYCTNGVCEACNKVGDKCCDLGRGNFCLDLVCDNGTCKNCGGEGQLCCVDEYTAPSDYFERNTPLCDKEDQVCKNGRCVASENGCYGTACKSNEQCDDYDFTCYQCGVDGNQCCSNDTCVSDDLTCFYGTCECGGKEQKCCNSAKKCDKKSLECRDGLCQKLGSAAKCGEKGQECCDGGLCVKNAFCNKAQNKCRACGLNSQKCCPGKKCANARLTCNSDGRCVRD